MKYPSKVHGEFETMRLVAAGASIARFGDGELKMMCGMSQVRENASPRIRDELTDIFNNPTPDCLVGIPTLDPRGPKYDNWMRHVMRFERVLNRKGPWYSAFVTRPDSAPWIETPEYYDLVVSCWEGKRAVLICEPTSKLLPVLRRTAGEVVHVECRDRDMYQHVPQLEQTVVGMDPEVTVISMGVSATCLAHRLARRGLHAIDFGSAGGMMVRLMERRTQ